MATSASPTSNRRISLLCLGLAVISGALAAEAPPSTIAFDLPAAALEPALKRFSGQSGRQVVFASELGQGVRTREVQGPLTPQAALDRLLAGTGLAAKADDPAGAFVVVRASTGTAAVAPLDARAVIVIGLTADEAQARRMRQQAGTAREGFLARGVPAGAIVILGPLGGAAVRRDAVLAALRPATPPAAESWLLLLGQAAKTHDGLPAYQVSGPRLSATELATAVGALPGRKNVVIATAASGGFLPALLALPDIEAVAATAEAGEINEPSFAQMWVDALVAAPRASFRELAVEAAARVEALYEQRQIGRGEHAQLIDRAAGQIVAAPFLPATPAATAASSAR